MWQKEKFLVLSNYFFCHYVFKNPSAAEASESVYMREKVIRWPCQKNILYTLSRNLSINWQNLIKSPWSCLYYHYCLSMGEPNESLNHFQHTNKIYWRPLPKYPAKMWQQSGTIVELKILKQKEKLLIMSTFFFSQVLKILPAADP